MINTFDVNKNFWIEHPDMRAVNPFKTLYDDDTSKKKSHSSLIMWFVILCYDRDSKFYRLEADGDNGKHVIVGEDFCENKDFYRNNKAVLDMCIDMYIRMQYTPLERHLKTWEDLLDKRTAFIKEQEYDLETYDSLDKMAIGTDKVYNTIKKINDDLSKEDGSGSAKGGAMPSLND